MAIFCVELCGQIFQLTFSDLALTQAAGGIALLLLLMVLSLEPFYWKTILWTTSWLLTPIVRAPLDWKLGKEMFTK